MSEYFPEPKSSGGRVKVKLDLSNYVTKADWKKGVDTSKFAKKVDLVSIKYYLDKSDIVELKNTPSNLTVLKITAGQQSLTVITEDVTSKKLRWMITMTANT